MLSRMQFNSHKIGNVSTLGGGDYYSRMKHDCTNLYSTCANCFILYHSAAGPHDLFCRSRIFVQKWLPTRQAMQNRIVTPPVTFLQYYAAAANSEMLNYFNCTRRPTGKRKSFLWRWLFLHLKIFVVIIYWLESTNTFRNTAKIAFFNVL